MAESGVSYGEEFVYNTRGMKLFTCHWVPAEKEVRALVFLCHGYAMECSNYTRETGMRLARAGYAVYGIDYEGHGKSEGLQCYVPSFDQLVADCDEFFRSVLDREEYINKPRFIYGESMGGAVAILVSQRNPSLWNGLILVAPMCKISEKMKPPGIVTSILMKVCHFIPTWKIVPTKSVIDSAFKDPIKREEIRSNPMAYQGQPRLLTALEMLRASTELEKNLDKISLPFLVLHGEADIVTDPEVSRALYDESVSYDKTLKIYPGMWHGLTTGEPDHNVEIVFRDITNWLDKRAQDAETVTSPQLRSSALASFDSKFSSRGMEIALKGQHDTQILQAV
ncbi:acylglycerol lipase [Marchantia polymorpha subsp. ruderalis]|uniref:Serine aminopeptidase S33 domain-containing protein n=2 Tax=Marchantia polymorpha TaxID=3197 RepID=A0A176W3K8_MARPO|nr:hypothetical protein AXG93_4638s1000 [Marchantia polymorpha subsp. ruderalis]PTQ33770.1 hypothetical protein MARPO_0086s0084 [Marchantia polymorpha]BBN11070.1 hypothetical protein Mp_5g08770 [Marchantia polymorpha subsp. ruderalis]|eukprot:PTQ33770.1 hypothetical protein MARPO_0086s0084 [Marchantia polymorpha]